MQTDFESEQRAVLHRVIKASFAALVVVAFYVWHNVSAQRTAARAEQARINALALTPQKQAVLAREAERDAAANAFAEKEAAEQLARARVDAEEQAQATAPRAMSSHGG